MNHLSDSIRQLSQRYFPLQWSLGSAKGSFWQGLASSRMGIAKPIPEVLMKKLFPALLSAIPCFAGTARMRVGVCTALVLFASCTNTQVRWDAVKMRQDVMVYYNDQIMENLIRAKNDLPFVHVDIQTLTSAGASQITGSVGYGETTTNTGTRVETNQNTITNSSTPPGPVTTHTVASIVGGLVATATHTAMRPFSYSVSPTRSETLTIVAAPALGPQSQASPAPTATPEMTPTKNTETREKWEEKSIPESTTTPSPTKPDEHSGRSIYEKVTTTKEKTLLPAPQPPVKTIYNLYEEFAKPPCKPCERPSKPRKPCEDYKGYLCCKSKEPDQGTYVPGTLKKWRTENRTEYYFVAKKNQEKYYELCKSLFTKGAGGSLEQKVQELTGRVNTLNATPIPP